MRKSFFCGVDIGTYESKGVITDESMNIVAYHSCPHVMSSPKPGYAEHDALGVWYKDLCEITNALIEKSGIDPKDVASFGCSTIAPCCLPVDKEMNPLTQAMLYGVDVRAAKEIEYLIELFGEEKILSRCGSPVTSQSAAAKILWLKNNLPEVYDKAAYFLTGTSFLTAKLTGNVVIDNYTAAAFVPAYDITKNSYDLNFLRPICSEDKLARCMWTNEIAGHITSDAALDTGLAEGTPVIVGTADASAEATSAGVISVGDMLLMYGSSIFIIHVTDKPYPDKRIWTGPYLFEGTYDVSAGMSTTGTLTRWFRDNFSIDLLSEEKNGGMNAYDALALEAKDVKAGSGGLIVLPYFSGERTPINDPLAKGVIFGLNLTHTRGHVFNACMEGVGYGIGQHFEVFAENGIETKRVFAVGGGTKNEKWLQIVSDISNMPQLLPEVSVGAAYGDAMLAALGVGRFATPEEMTSVTKIRKIVKPGNTVVYEPYRKAYAELYKATKNLMHSAL
ncbi:MAG: FGGY-family carbohydrate kinase [Clostridiales bacterium]|nr:FGGY-family carbohydrate kinase [Clostridiales bacterium]